MTNATKIMLGLMGVATGSIIFRRIRGKIIPIKGNVINASNRFRRK